MLPKTKILFTQESQLQSRYQGEIRDFWQGGLFEHFVGADQIKIQYAAFVNSSHERNLVIVPGRIEGYLKYQELCFDWYQAGFNIFIIDHRGQGLSDRLLENQHKGHVENFDHYSDDLHHFIDKVLPEKFQADQPYILAHSMGGAISTRYLQRFESSVKAAVFTAPMIAISSGAAPSGLAKAAVKLSYRVSKLLGFGSTREANYFLGQGNYHNDAFAGNNLCQSKLRYQIFRDLYQAEPKLQLGGVTSHWLMQALQAERDIFTDLNQLTTPILVIQAGGDTIVDNGAQTRFCQQLHQLKPELFSHSTPIVVDGARHELLFELDQYRNQALSTALEWFNKHG